MSRSQTIAYTANIIRAGAPLTNDKDLLSLCDETLSTSENLNRFKRENHFSISSRSRIREILLALDHRSPASEPVNNALATSVNFGCRAEALVRFLNFYEARFDLLLHDSVTEMLTACLQHNLQNTNISNFEAWTKLYQRPGLTFPV